MINFEVKISDLSLYIDDQFEDIANKFCNTGKDKPKQHKLNSWFEGFIYTALIGINIESREKYKNKKEKFRRWSTFRDHLNFVFMKVLTKDDVRNELKILEFDQIKNDFISIDELLKNLFEIIGEYSNGGLKYLKENYEKNNSLFESLYALEEIYVDTIPKLNEKDLLEIEEEERITQIIHSGESPEVEFKSTLRINLHTGKSHKDREDDCMKAIAGFMNSKGGTLIIGVKDDQQILGLNEDFESFKKDDKMDEFQKHLDNILERSFSSSCFSLLKINFPIIDGKTICKIKVKPSSKPTYFENTKFFIRRNASTKELLAGDMMNYIQEHFKD